MANFDVNVYIIARDNSCKIGRAPYGVRLIFYNDGRAPADVFIYRRRTAPVRYVTTQEKILKKSSGARAIIKFAGDVQIAEIVRCQFYLWP